MLPPLEVIEGQRLATRLDWGPPRLLVAAWLSINELATPQRSLRLT